MTTFREQPDASRPTTFRARTADDLLAFIPIALGFVPAESVVMITLGAAGPHARVAVPRSDYDAEVVADQLCRACLFHSVTRVVLVIYVPEPASERALAWQLSQRMEACGVEVLEVLGASATQWVPLLAPDAAQVPQPYDALAHPYRTEAVVDGRVVLGSREELQARLTSDPDLVARTEVHVAELGDLDPAQEVAHGEWIRARASDYARRQELPDPSTAARMLWGLDRPRVRDRVWGRIRRAEARGQIDLWLGLVRCSPAGQVAHTAAVLAFVAWLSGNGALAWCAVDRSQQAGESSLTAMVGRLMLEAVPPMDAHEVALRQEG